MPKYEMNQPLLSAMLTQKSPTIHLSANVNQGGNMNSEEAMFKKIGHENDSYTLKM